MDYKPYSIYNHFELIHKCFNRDCSKETTSYFDIDITKHCTNCNEKTNQYIMQTYYNKKHAGIEDWEDFRGIEIHKSCSKCEKKEKKSYSYSLLKIAKTCFDCGTLSPLIFIKFLDISFKINLPAFKFGRFDCEACDNSWTTYFIYWGCKHQCKKCFSLLYPTDISVEYYNSVDYENYCPPKIEGNDKNHNVKLCEKCVVKGEVCYIMNNQEISDINRKRGNVRIKINEEKNFIDEKKNNEHLNFIKIHDLSNNKVALKQELDKEKIIEDEIVKLR